MNLKLLFSVFLFLTSVCVQAQNKMDNQSRGEMKVSGNKTLDPKKVDRVLEIITQNSKNQQASATPSPPKQVQQTSLKIEPKKENINQSVIYQKDFDSLGNDRKQYILAHPEIFIIKKN